MKKIHLLLLIFVLMMTSLACGLGGGSSTSSEEAPAEEPGGGEAVEEEAGEFAGKPAAAASMLGEIQNVPQGGFSFKAIPGYELEIANNMAFMVAPGGDYETGPLVMMWGEAGEESTLEELMEELKSETDIEFGDVEKIDKNGVPGIVIDIGGDDDSGPMMGKAAMALVTPTQKFFMMAGAVEDEWAELEPYWDALLESLEFFEIEAEAAVSQMPAGMYVYTNRNAARDVAVHDGVIYTATLGGMVAWRLDSGYRMAYTPLDGMGHISAQAVAACDVPDTRIIVGTLTGLSIYDPSTGLWENDTITPESSKVSTTKVNRLYCDAENRRLLIGYNGLGVLDLQSGEFSQYTTTDEKISWNAVNDIAVDGKDIWVTSGYNGITRIRDGQSTIYNEDSGMPDETAYAVAVAPDGALWVGAGDGLMRFKGNQWTLYGSDTPAKLSSVSEIEITPEGDIWVATFPFGAGRLCQFNIKDQSCVIDHQAEDGMPIYGLALDDEGNPIYATNKGVYLFDGTSAKPFLNEDDQLASNFVDSFAASSDGRMWVGTDGGIHLIDAADADSTWETFNSNDTPGMGGNWASGIAVSPDGAAWFAIINGSASRYKDAEWTNYEDVYGFSSVTIDADGNAWFADDGNGIVVLDNDGKKMMEFTTENSELPDDSVYAILADGDTVWIGSNGGLAKAVDGSIQVVFGEEDDELPQPYVRALALDENGDLLIGANLSVVRYDGSSTEVLFDFMENGINDWLTEMVVASDGSIWVGTYNGVYYLDNAGGFTWMTTKDGLPTNGISALFVDQFDTVWVGGGGSNFDGGGIVHIVR